MHCKWEKEESGKFVSRFSCPLPLPPLMIQHEEYVVYIPSGDWLGSNDLCKKSIARMENVVKQCKRAYWRHVYFLTQWGPETSWSLWILLQEAIPHGSNCDAPSAGSQTTSEFSLEDLAWALIHKQRNKLTRRGNMVQPKRETWRLRCERTRTKIARKKTSTFWWDGYR